MIALVPVRDRPEDDRPSWVSRQLGRPLNAAEACLVGVLCSAVRRGPYDLQWTSLRSTHADHAQVSIWRDLTTWDADALTRLVFGAHDACARVGVEPCNPRYMRIVLHLRNEADPKVGIARHHPTIERAVELWREKHPGPVQAQVSVDEQAESLEAFVLGRA